MPDSSTFTPDHAYEQIADTTLHPLQEQGPVKAYYLKKYPDSRMMSTLLIFSPEGITITGDLRPCRNGVTIMGYGLEWFTGKLEPRYLAEKCLSGDHYDSERARAEIEQAIRDATKDAWAYRDEGSLSQAKAVRAGFRALEEFRDWSEGAVYDAFRVALDDGVYGIGRDYDTGDFAWLSAIQRRFAETYRAHQQEKAAAAVPSAGGAG